MIYVRLAESAESATFSCVCDSITEAMYAVHRYVYGAPKRVGEIVHTDMPFPYECGADYTNNGNFSADAMTEATFERFYQTRLY